MESLPQTPTQKIFPVFMSMAVLMVSLVYYGMSGLIIGQKEAVVLGASTEVVMKADLEVRTDYEVRKYNDLVFESGDNALEFLDVAEDKTSFTYSASRYDFGWYVYTVNGRRALNNEYWSLVINGEEWEGSVEDYVLKPEDALELVLKRL